MKWNENNIYNNNYVYISSLWGINDAKSSPSWECISVYKYPNRVIHIHPFVGSISRAIARNKCWKIRRPRTQHKRQKVRPVHATIALSSNSLFEMIGGDLRPLLSARKENVHLLFTLVVSNNASRILTRDLVFRMPSL